MDNYTLKQLEDLIRNYMSIPSDEPIPTSVKKQITRFVLSEEMTYKEIGRSICYYVEVKKKQIDSLYGISFVPNVKKDANLYFAKLEEKKNEQIKEAKKFSQTDEVMIYNVKEIIKANKSKKLEQLSFDGIDLKGEKHGQ